MASIVLGSSMAYAGGDPVVICRAAKGKCICKKVCSRLKAIASNEKKPDPAKFAANNSKLEAKYSQCMSKADAKGGCPLGASTATLEQKVDDFVDDVLDEIGSPSGAFL
ncbi:MAG TPA: hypothetical protein VKA21_13090 [Candidatus Binatia bacterium]|nr:hypothetical protein [Candidatus Binatia bacterium]